MDAINAEVIGPSGPVYLNFDLGPNGGRGSFQVSFSIVLMPAAFSGSVKKTRTKFMTVSEF